MALIVDDIQQILRQAQDNAVRSINRTMVEAYWQVGRRIVEEEQQGEGRVAYGKALIKNLSKELLTEFGKGFSERNLEQMRSFYLNYPIPQTVSAELQRQANFETLSINFKMPEFRYKTLLPDKEALRKLLSEKNDRES